MSIVSGIWLFLRALFLSRTSIAAEQFAVRQQVVVIRGSVKWPRTSRDGIHRCAACHTAKPDDNSAKDQGDSSLSQVAEAAATRCQRDLDLRLICN